MSPFILVAVMMGDDGFSCVQIEYTSDEKPKTIENRIFCEPSELAMFAMQGWVSNIESYKFMGICGKCKSNK